MTIRVTDEGKILIKCWSSECNYHDIVCAVGLEDNDLFPPRLLGDPIKPLRKPFPASDVLEALSYEATVVHTIAAGVLAGKHITPKDYDRLVLANSRLHNATRSLKEVKYGHF